MNIGVDGGALSIKDMVRALRDFPHETVAPIRIIAAIHASASETQVLKVSCAVHHAGNFRLAEAERYSPIAFDEGCGAGCN